MDHPICEKCGEVDRFVHTDMNGNDPETCPWCYKMV